MGLQEVTLTIGFHTLGNYFQIQAVAQRDDCTAKGGIIGIDE